MESVTEFIEAGYTYCGQRSEGGRIVVSLSWERRPEACLRCGHAVLHSHGWRARRLSHAPIGAAPCDLLITFRRFRCAACRASAGSAQPGVAPRARISAALAEFVRLQVLWLGSALSRLGQWLGLGHHALRRCLPAPDGIGGIGARELADLCIDEVYFHEPRQFLSVLSTARGKVLGLCEGRGEAPTRKLLCALPGAVREGVRTLATDLSAGQRKAARECLPDALICADHFHLARLITRMLRETARAYPKHSRPQQCAKQAAWELRELLKRRDWPAADRAMRTLAEWIERFAGSQGPLGKLWRLVEGWQLEIEGYMLTRRTTGPAEALNRKIAALRRRACGYTNLGNFSHRILLLNLSSHH
jgi:transposase